MTNKLSKQGSNQKELPQNLSEQDKESLASAIKQMTSAIENNSRLLKMQNKVVYSVADVTRMLGLGRELIEKLLNIGAIPCSILKKGKEYSGVRKISKKGLDWFVDMLADPDCPSNFPPEIRKALIEQDLITQLNNAKKLYDKFDGRIS